jgi:XisH protein
MAKKDQYHDVVRRALEKESWDITDDPLFVQAGKRKLKIDLGAERLIGAERNGEKIAVEIKSFLRESAVYDFYGALGQFRFYFRALQKSEPDRVLYLAISQDVYDDFFDEAFVLEVVELEGVRMLVYSILEEKIIRWIN